MAGFTTLSLALPIVPFLCTHRCDLNTVIWFDWHVMERSNLVYLFDACVDRKADSECGSRVSDILTWR